MRNWLKEHLFGHHVSDDIASFLGGALFANIFSANFINHMVEVAIVGFVGGAFGLAGKLLIQFFYDKFFKKDEK